MKKRILSIAVAVIALAGINLTPVHSSANEYLAKEDFTNLTALPETWAVVKQDENNSVSVREGKLLVENVSGATEIQLPAVDKADYVLEFTATRLSGDTFFSVRYRQDEAREEGYELRVHYQQKGGFAQYHQEYFDKETWPFSGLGLENWQLAQTNAQDGTFKGTQYQFGFYETELYTGQEYVYRMELVGDSVELYINDVLCLRDKLDVVTEDGRFAFYAEGATSFTIDDLTVYSLDQYAEEKIARLPEILPEQTAKVVSSYKRAVQEVESYLENMTTQEIAEIANYSKYEETKSAIETHYGVVASRKPVITVAWDLQGSYPVGSKVRLPEGTATDKNGAKYAVTSKILYTGKTLKQQENGTYALNVAGDYTVVYTATNVYGESSSVEYKITVMAANK